MLSSPYIDLNPGSPDRLIIEATRQRLEQAHEFARSLGATEIVVLSSFLPIVYLSFYEEGWVIRSVAFWRAYLDNVDPNIVISLGNTFEFSPEHLVRVVEAVNRPNFRLTFDLGHFLVYSKVDLEAWLKQIAPHCSTVYVHSNNGRIDTHDEPFTGILRSEQLAQVAAALPATTKFLAKMNNKATLRESVKWIENSVSKTS
jgi:sugar phosphate isomerase/epimerase